MREFLEYFNLEFTQAVFEPESGLVSTSIPHLEIQVPSDSVVECLTPCQGAAGSSLTLGTALCP